MKKYILVWSLLSVFLLMVVPTVGAVEYKQVTEIQKFYIQEVINKFQEEIHNIDFEDLKTSLNKHVMNINAE